MSINAFEGGINAIRFCFHTDGLGLQHNVVKALLVKLLPDFDEIAIRTRHQAIEHLDHIEARAQRGIHRAHFEADNTAADDEQLLRNFFQCQCARRINNTRIVGNEGQSHHLRSGCDDGFFETNDFLLAGLCLAVTGGCFDHEMIGIQKLANTAHHIHLAHFGHGGEAAGQFTDDFIFPAAQFIQINLGLAKSNAVGCECAGFIGNGGDVKQRFRWDTTNVQADAAELCVALNDDGFHAKVGGAKGGRIAARTGAQYQRFAGDVDRAGISTCRRRCGRFY